MAIKVAHLLRKYNPDQWGGTESAVMRLVQGLRRPGAESVVFCPGLNHKPSSDPFKAAGIKVKTYRAILPVARIAEAQRQELISVGGNILSFDLIGQLLREKNLSIIHTHATNRLGGTALTVARLRRIPIVVSIHGGHYDLPKSVSEQLVRPLKGGVDWGKAFGLLLRSKKVIPEADAVVTCNTREADLIRERFPRQRVMVQSHGVSARRYAFSEEQSVKQAYPQLAGHPYLMVLGRLDPVKNQGWLLEQAPALLARYPRLRIVLAGACTMDSYGAELEAIIRKHGLEDRVLRTGGLPPEDPRLVGLLQGASAVVLPSVSETFGLVILEAWAAGAPVITSKTSGALGLVKDGETGWLFNLSEPSGFHLAADQVLGGTDSAQEMARRGRQEVLDKYDTDVLVVQLQQLYEELINRPKKVYALCDHPR